MEFYEAHVLKIEPERKELLLCGRYEERDPDGLLGMMIGVEIFFNCYYST